MAFLGIAWHDTRDAMRAFVEEYGIGMPTAVDESDAIFGRFGFFYQPAWAFVSSEGDVETHFGELSPEALAGRIDRLVA